MVGWVWGIVGGIAGTVLGVVGAMIGVYNSRRIGRGEESFLNVKSWNMYDFFYTFLIIAGLLSLTASLFFIRSSTMDDAYALSLFSLTFLFIGSLNAILRVRALQHTVVSEQGLVALFSREIYRYSTLL